MAPINPFPIAASLTLRLAEAADGFRNIPEVFFVVKIASPHDIFYFETLEDAMAYYDKENLNPEEYAIYGPFEAKNNPPVKFDKKPIDKIVVRVEYKDKTNETINLEGQTDAVFFNLSSLDKFIIPYYTKLYGVDRAKEIRDGLISNATKSQASLLIFPHVRVTITKADKT